MRRPDYVILGLLALWMVVVSVELHYIRRAAHRVEGLYKIMVEAVGAGHDADLDKRLRDKRRQPRKNNTNHDKGESPESR